MNKSFESQTDENELSKEDLALINTFTQKEMTKDDIFSFCVILCDNEIDRDYERFTEDSLHKLADFFYRQNRNTRSQHEKLRPECANL